MTQKLTAALSKADISRAWRANAIDGAVRIVTYGYANKYSTAEIAFNLAQAEHETGRWMAPIREGCSRQGPAGTDAQAREAIASALRKGLIKLDYLTAVNGQSYYGRGLIQITWKDNYAKFERITGRPLVGRPDLALEWPVALGIMYKGINLGVFRKAKFSDFITGVPTVSAYASARNIVNGDTRKYGVVTGERAMLFYQALLPLERELRGQSTAKPSLFGMLNNLFERWK